MISINSINIGFCLIAKNKLIVYSSVSVYSNIHPINVSTDRS